MKILFNKEIHSYGPLGGSHFYCQAILYLCYETNDFVPIYINIQQFLKSLKVFELQECISLRSLKSL